MKAKIMNFITGEPRRKSFIVGDVKDAPAAFEEALTGLRAMLQFISL